MSKISGYNDGWETVAKHLSLAGGPHIMSVADIRNELFSDDNIVLDKKGAI